LNAISTNITKHIKKVAHFTDVINQSKFVTHQVQLTQATNDSRYFGEKLQDAEILMQSPTPIQACTEAHYIKTNSATES